MVVVRTSDTDDGWVNVMHHSSHTDRRYGYDDADNFSETDAAAPSDRDSVVC